VAASNATSASAARENVGRPPPTLQLPDDGGVPVLPSIGVTPASLVPDGQSQTPRLVQTSVTPTDVCPAQSVSVVHGMSTPPSV
jgi:hypothetical protein